VVFTSWAFALFFATVMLGLYLIRTRTARQAWILLASAYFYSYANPWYLALLAIPSVIDYVAAIRIEDGDDPVRRKRWLIFSLVTNLGLLGYFKYTNFFLDSVAAVVGASPRHLEILLPVGISFYTFKTLSYTIDVYRGELPACREWWRYAMFVMYFPELVAGPIVRASVFLPQMGRSLRPSWARAIVGFQAVLLGVTKKVLVADRLAIFVDPVFASPGSYSPTTVASAIVAYSLQLYCDFSGYSDIAIGISRVIGFDLPENFNMPYISTSLTEFWRRWHITLSLWLRDYLYYPLGGSRKGQIRTYVNLLITMLVAGLWHGAGWTLVVFGLLHGIGLGVHKIWSERVSMGRRPFHGAVGWVLTYSFACTTMVLFRAADFGTAMVMFEKIIGLAPGGAVFVYAPFFELLPVVIAAHLIGVVVARQESGSGGGARAIPAPAWAVRVYRRAGSRFAIRPHPAAGAYALLPMRGFPGALVLTVWVVGLFLFATIDTSPFIYFQF
jgi:alginate O-acetyltransferase complex protein AlgI